PRDNIERAIKKASGEGAAVSYEDLVYEVYGPSGVAILIELSTDNRNRTSAEIRAILTRHNGSMATSGAVSRLFQKKGQFIIEREAADEDKLMEVAMNAGAEDFKSEPEGYEIITEPGDFETVSKALDEAGITCANASITQLPTMITPVAPDMVEVVQKLIDALEDQDDVQEVFTNADM
ncbi:MAG: YebC/PmpR family DNA-binding transcriptional regulator, partial [Verrucomicrobia bacterium]|nr:YebC/PmpR family DNA-binding transcriptional regulator [Verrucomicrobiota bacterium]